MKTKFLFLVVILSLTLVSTKAQTETKNSYNLNLDECIKYAFEHQIALLNANLDQKIADAKVKETIGIGLPQVSGTMDFNDFLKRPTSLFPDFVKPTVYDIIDNENIRDASGNVISQPSNVGGLMPVQFQQKYNSSAALSVTQLLFSGSYIIGLQAAKTYKELSSKAYSRSKIETNVAVTKAFYLVLVNNEQVELLNANIAQLKKQLDQTNALFKNGFVEKIDADRLTVLYNNLTTEKENILRSLALGIDFLKFQMGMPITDDLVIKGKINEVKFDEIALTTDTSDFSNRIEYNLAKTQLKLSELDLKRYKSDYLPTLIANGSGAYQYQNNSFSDLYTTKYPTASVGLRLSIPIFSSGQRYYKVKQAKYSVQKSINDLSNTKNAIQLDIKRCISNYTNSLNSLQNQKRNLDLANEVLKVSKIKYEQGVGSSLEVTQAQTLLKEAENNYINALYEALSYKVDTEKATGKIKY
jgi:outer membrane protein